MKRFLAIFILSISLSSVNVNAEEVTLDIKNDRYAVSLEENSTQEKTLKEKLLEIYLLEIERTDKPAFLLSNILTKEHSKKSIWDKTQVWASYSGNTSFNFADNESFGSNYSFDYINLGLDGYLKNNNGDFRIMLNVNPLSNRDFAQILFADTYIATNKIPHHRFWFGNTRPPVGMEGGYSPFLLPFVSRSQISRTFGTVRRFGARASGNYDLIDYDLGVYSSDTYFQSFFPGTEFVGWINFKPLGKTNGKYGKLILGGGLQSGERSCNYNVKGAYAGYEYKKWWLNFEWADADGYNGPIGYSIDRKASGFYTTLAYKVSPKLQVLLRYDEFDPDKNIIKNNRREYVAGINYFIKGQALKMMLNYVFCQNNANRDSHRLILGTQILL
ncbi:hypothetical protein IKB17_07030 [bacterium]|nr:hypothetical protein [bacterium]